MPVMSYALCPNLKKMSVFCHRRRIEIFCHLFSIPQRPNVCFSRHLPGARHIITGLRVSSVTLGWVGAPNERAPFKFHDAIAAFADRCLKRTRIADRRPGFGGASPAQLNSPRELPRRVQNLPRGIGHDTILELIVFTTD